VNLLPSVKTLGYFAHQKAKAQGNPIQNDLGVLLPI
jgi:hypothetical protein